MGFKSYCTVMLTRTISSDETPNEKGVTENSPNILLPHGFTTIRNVLIDFCAINLPSSVSIQNSWESDMLLCQVVPKSCNETVQTSLQPFVDAGALDYRISCIYNILVLWCVCSARVSGPD